MSDFIKCEKGHVYNKKLKECPFCNGKTLEEALQEIAQKEGGKNIRESLDLVAMCYEIGPRDF